MRRGNPLIYSATEGNFCIWPPVLLRCRPCHGLQGRKLIHHDPCVSSLDFRREAAPISPRGSSDNGCQSGSATHFLLRTVRERAVTSRPRRWCVRRLTATHCSWSVRHMRLTRPSTTSSITISSVTSRLLLEL